MLWFRLLARCVLPTRMESTLRAALNEVCCCETSCGLRVFDRVIPVDDEACSCGEAIKDTFYARLFYVCSCYTFSAVIRIFRADDIDGEAVEVRLSYTSKLLLILAGVVL